MSTQYRFLVTWLKAQTASDRGAALVEYALLVVMIAIVAIVSIRVLGGTLSTKFSDIDSGVNS